LGDGAWHHVAATWDPAEGANVTDAKLYVDGELDPIAASAGATINTGTNQSVVVGELFADPDTDPFDGLIDDVRIYDRSLTASEMQSIYHDSWAVYRQRSKAYRLFILGAYDVTMLDAATIADAANEDMSADAAIAEAASLADSAPGEMTAQPIRAEVASIVDALSEAMTAAAAVAESASMADVSSLSVVLAAAIAEAATLIDAVSQGMTAPLSIAEAATLADSLSEALREGIILALQAPVSRTFEARAIVSRTMELTAEVRRLLTAHAKTED